MGEIWTDLLVATIGIVATVWTGWNTLTPRSAKRALAGLVQRAALRPGLPVGLRNRLLGLADRMAGTCCHD